jgi:acetolactate synthase-1/3 small subunit
MLVHDRPGVMMKITGMFARRGFNIASITVGHSERPGFSRITIGAEGDEKTIEQIMKQLHKLIDVVKVQELIPETTTIRMCALVKVAIKDHNTREGCVTTIELFNAKAIDVTPNSMTIEIVGSERKIESFIEVISDITQVKEIVRSGVIAISRGEKSITLE